MISFTKNVSVLSDEELVNYSTQMVQHENKVELHLIECLREAERRMLYATLNLNNLWDYATQVLKMSTGNAQQKINAMRLSRDNPVAQKNIQSGDLSIKNAARLNQFFRQEKKAGHT